jgi:hypothetical protein
MRFSLPGAIGSHLNGQSRVFHNRYSASIFWDFELTRIESSAFSSSLQSITISGHVQILRLEITVIPQIKISLYLTHRRSVQQKRPADLFKHNQSNHLPNVSTFSRFQVLNVSIYKEQQKLYGDPAPTNA